MDVRPPVATAAFKPALTGVLPANQDIASRGLIPAPCPLPRPTMKKLLACLLLFLSGGAWFCPLAESPGAFGRFFVA